jgi:hypothetical protein
VEVSPLICICHITTAVAPDGYRSAATVVIFPVVQALTGAGLTIIGRTLRLARRWSRRRLTAACEIGRQAGAVGDSPAGKGSLRSPS